eukprot:g12044.t1
MKPASSLVFIAALLAAPAAAVEYTVSTCGDLADVDDTLATGLTIESSSFVCDEYTRFRVRNTMTLKATVPTVEFGNFSLKVLGDLTVEPDVVFEDVVEQVVNGGVIYVEEGATATFMGFAEFNDNSGMLTFEGEARFTRNEVRTDDSVEQGTGGAISNTGSGSILFKSVLILEDNNADGSFAGIGGGIYNRGDVNGGAIYQTSIGTMTFNSKATFSSNTAFDFKGGATDNERGVMIFNDGSLFEFNYASGSGDGGDGGAIYNTDGGVITLTGSTTFDENKAYRGGAIFTDDDPVATTTFPDDAIFTNNEADIADNMFSADLVDASFYGVVTDPADVISASITRILLLYSAEQLYTSGGVLPTSTDANTFVPMGVTVGQVLEMEGDEIGLFLRRDDGFLYQQYIEIADSEDSPVNGTEADKHSIDSPPPDEVAIAHAQNYITHIGFWSGLINDTATRVKGAVNSMSAEAGQVKEQLKIRDLTDASVSLQGPSELYGSIDTAYEALDTLWEGMFNVAGELESLTVDAFQSMGAALPLQEQSFNIDTAQAAVENLVGGCTVYFDVLNSQGVQTTPMTLRA